MTQVKKNISLVLICFDEIDGWLSVFLSRLESGLSAEVDWTGLGWMELHTDR